MSIFRRKKKIISDEPIKINDFLFEGSYIKDFTYFSKFKFLPINEIVCKICINTTANKIMENISSWEKEGIITIDKVSNMAYLTDTGKAVLGDPKFSEKLLKDMLGSVSDKQKVIFESETHTGEAFESWNELEVEIKSINSDDESEVQDIKFSAANYPKKHNNSSTSNAVAYSAVATLTPTESNFFHNILNPIVTKYGGHIDKKMGIKDLVAASKSNPEFISNFNKISKKHIDFSVFENNAPKDFRDNPVFLIELDDPSHNTNKAKTNDEFKNRLFEATGIPLERIFVDSDQKLKVQVEQLCQKYLKKFIIYIKYDEKDEAKAIGGRYLRYDGCIKKWYVIGEITLRKLLSHNICRVFLNISFEEKDEAKALGAKWSGKRWYIDTDINFDKFKKWID